MAENHLSQAVMFELSIRSWTLSGFFGADDECKQPSDLQLIMISDVDSFCIPTVQRIVA
jgi:hypothetical protein